MRRVAAFLVRNWPLKLAALALATLLYTGLALSQGASVFRDQIPIFPENQPDDAVLLTPLSELVVTSVSYVATDDIGQLSADDFRATIDLSSVEPGAGPQSVPVQVRPLPRGITVVDVTPQRVQVALDPFVERTVPVVVDIGPPPANAEIGTVEVDPETVTVRGAQSVVTEVVSARASVPLDASGLDFRGDVELVPVDREGRELQVDVSPELARVVVPVITARRQGTLPVNPEITGTVADGMRIASVEVTPPVVTLEGDADDLEPLSAADTEPIPVSGLDEDLDVQVQLALPEGVVAVGEDTVRVVIRTEEITDTRTFTAAVRVAGLPEGASATLSDTEVVVALFGPVTSLDAAAAGPLLATVDATGLGAGQHQLEVVADVPDGVSVADVSPPTVTVTIVGPPSPSPADSPSPAP